MEKFQEKFQENFQEKFQENFQEKFDAIHDFFNRRRKLAMTLKILIPYLLYCGYFPFTKLMLKYTYQPLTWVLYSIIKIMPRILQFPFIIIGNIFGVLYLLPILIIHKRTGFFEAAAYATNGCPVTNGWPATNGWPLYKPVLNLSGDYIFFESNFDKVKEKMQSQQVRPFAIGGNSMKETSISSRCPIFQSNKADSEWSTTRQTIKKHLLAVPTDLNTYFNTDGKLIPAEKDAVSIFRFLLNLPSELSSELESLINDYVSNAKGMVTEIDKISLSYFSKAIIEPRRKIIEIVRTHYIDIDEATIDEATIDAFLLAGVLGCLHLVTDLRMRFQNKEIWDLSTSDIDLVIYESVRLNPPVTSFNTSESDGIHIWSIFARHIDPDIFPEGNTFMKRPLQLYKDNLMAWNGVGTADSQDSLKETTYPRRCPGAEISMTIGRYYVRQLLLEVPSQ